MKQGAICWKKQNPPEAQTLKPQAGDKVVRSTLWAREGCGYANILRRERTILAAQVKNLHRKSIQLVDL